MAIKLPGLPSFKDMGAKTRILILVGVVFVLGLIIYFGASYFSSSTDTSRSQVASAPGGLQSVPGSKLSPEYYRALMQANVQASQQAQISGGSAVPTLVNVPGQNANNCTIVCPSDETANVADDINNLVRTGKLSQDDANRLLDLAKNNVSVDDYAAALDDLVKQGKLTPEQARQLLDKYKKQHDNALLTESAKTMDGLIKSGQLPLSVANDLLALQKKKVTPAEYAAELNRLVREGKISPATAAQLLAQYTQQNAKESRKPGGPAATLNDMVAQNGQAAADELNDLVKSGKLSQDAANALLALQQQDVPVDQYANALNELVRQGKLSPADAQRLLASYKKLHDLKGETQRLAALQASNASPTEYANELKRAVQAGILTPEQAAMLLQQYQALTAPAAGVVPGVEANVPGAEDFAKLQQRLAAQQPTAIPTVATEQFSDAEAAAAAEAAQQRQQRIQDLAAAMSGQAQTLIAAWAPPTMTHQAGQAETERKVVPGEAGTAAVPGTASSSAASGTATTEKPPVIKAGTILFAVLDTTVDSDYPDTPVMATVVQGKFKGARLLGKLSLAQGKDKVSLNFNLMDEESWLKTKTVNAFAIDPDTARTVMASSVDHHYLMRYGSLFASSFLSGYSNAIMSSGSTNTTGIFGTSTTRSQFSPGEKIAVGLGKVGDAFTTVVQSYVNMPTTVKVNAGVGLGILFMADVAE